MLKRDLLPLIFYIFTLLLTLSKSGALCVLLAYTFYSIDVLDNKHVKRILLAIIPVSIIGVILWFGARFGADSILTHVSGLTDNLLGLAEAPFGRGVGAVGNFSELSETNVGDSSGESYFGTIIGQIGIFGIYAYFGIIWWVWSRCRSDSPFTSAVKYSTLAMLFAGFGSESAISYIGSGFLFPIIPLILKNRVTR